MANFLLLVFYSALLSNSTTQKPISNLFKFTSGNGGGRNDALLDSSTLELIQLEPLTQNGSIYKMPLRSEPRYFAINWPTRQTGWNMMILTNEGNGFSTACEAHVNGVCTNQTEVSSKQGGLRPPIGLPLATGDLRSPSPCTECKPQTIIFNLQAAIDYEYELTKALNKRPDYSPSAEFNQTFQDAHEMIVRPKVNDTARGYDGQIALELLVQAYNMLLTEYGIQQAFIRNKSYLPKVVNDTQEMISSSSPSSLAAKPVIAFTIDRTSNYKKYIDMAKSLGNELTWIRLVFDVSNNKSVISQPAVAKDYQDIISYAIKKNVTIVGQPCDSSYDKNLTIGQYMNIFKLCVNTYSDILIWEVGNEVNGEWLSSTIANKTISATEYLQNYPSKRYSFLTLFWQITTGTKKGSLFNWINNSLPLDFRSKLDMVTLSIYPEQAPLGVSFDTVYTAFVNAFPASQIAVGELGYWVQGQRYWWAFNQTDPNGVAKQTVCDKYYRFSYGYDRSIGAGFWWNFCSDMYKDPALQDVIKKIYSEITTLENL